MEKNDLKDVLLECEKSANIGYKIASSQYQNLNKTLSNAADKIRDTLVAFQNSSCYVSGATDALSQQLIDIEEEFNNLSFAFKEDLENLRENLSTFSITLFGRTMAGKSTLMEILTEGDGKSIGKGSQRTTRDIRKYTWNNLEITDVPGIGAFEGEEDEQIAFEAAKRADLILFLLSDDGPQMVDADCFSKIVDLGKPILCIMNVKVSVPQDRNIKLVSHDIQRKFDYNRLDELRKEFLNYAELFGQEWDNIPFIYVHLKAAFAAQHETDSQKSNELYRLSRIEYLKSKIINQVKNKGEFYRIKTFIDIVSKPMLSSMENLLYQSNVNSMQGRTVLSKKRQMVEWKERFIDEGNNSIHSLILNIKSQLNKEIASFAEEHYADKNADKAWNSLLNNYCIQEKCQDLLHDLEEQCNDKIREISRQIVNELNFVTSSNCDRSLRMNRLIDAKRMWDWSATIVGGGLTIASIIAGACGAAVAGPLGWAALAVGVVGVAGSFVFKSRDKKEKEARLRLETNLIKNVDTICASLERRMKKNFASLIEVRIESLLKELDRMNAVVFKLADTQKELAWSLDDHLLELSFQIIEQAIKLIGAEGLEYHIEQVGRVPGNMALLMLRDGSYFPEREKNELDKLIAERIGFVYNSDNKKTLISRVLGKSIDRNKIRIEEKIGVAHIPMEELNAFMQTRIRIAQQFAKIVITQ